MNNKEIVVDLLDRLPENASLQDIAKEIEFVAAVREGFDSYDREGGVSIDEARVRVSEWARTVSK